MSAWIKKHGLLTLVSIIVLGTVSWLTTSAADVSFIANKNYSSQALEFARNYHWFISSIAAVSLTLIGMTAYLWHHHLKLLKVSEEQLQESERLSKERKRAALEAKLEKLK